MQHKEPENPSKTNYLALTPTQKNFLFEWITRSDFKLSTLASMGLSKSKQAIALGCVLIEEHWSDQYRSQPGLWLKDEDIPAAMERCRLARKAHVAELQARAKMQKRKELGILEDLRSAMSSKKSPWSSSSEIELGWERTFFLGKISSPVAVSTQAAMQAWPSEKLGPWTPSHGECLDKARPKEAGHEVSLRAVITEKDALAEGSLSSSRGLVRRCNWLGLEAARLLSAASTDAAKARRLELDLKSAAADSKASAQKRESAGAAELFDGWNRITNLAAEVSRGAHFADSLALLLQAGSNGFHEKTFKIDARLLPLAERLRESDPEVYATLRWGGIHQMVETAFSSTVATDQSLVKEASKLLSRSHGGSQAIRSAARDLLQTGKAKLFEADRATIIWCLREAGDAFEGARWGPAELWDWSLVKARLSSDEERELYAKATRAAVLASFAWAAGSKQEQAPEKHNSSHHLAPYGNGFFVGRLAHAAFDALSFVWPGPLPHEPRNPKRNPKARGESPAAVSKLSSVRYEGRHKSREPSPKLIEYILSSASSMEEAGASGAHEEACQYLLANRFLTPQGLSAIERDRLATAISAANPKTDAADRSHRL